MSCVSQLSISISTRAIGLMLNTYRLFALEKQGLRTSKHFCTHIFISFPEARQDLLHEPEFEGAMPPEVPLVLFRLIFLKFVRHFSVFFLIFVEGLYLSSLYCTCISSKSYFYFCILSSRIFPCQLFNSNYRIN